MLIQNQSKRIYQLPMGDLRPMDVMDIPEEKVESVLSLGMGELVSLDIKAPEAPKAEEEAEEEIKDEFTDMKFEELKAYCKEHEIDFEGLKSKDQLRVKIRETLNA